MPELVIEAANLKIRLSPFEKAMALRRSDVTVPREVIAYARAVPNILKEVRGLRLPGAGFPGCLAVGIWRGRDYKDLALASGRGPGVVINLRGGEFDRILLKSDDAERLAAQLRGDRVTLNVRPK